MPSGDSHDLYKKGFGVNARNCIGLPVRQTLKSAAAAAVRRSVAHAAFQTQLASSRSPLESMHIHVDPSRSKRLAQLLRPHPGSTAGLVSEVSTLRRRLEASAAELEGGARGGACGERQGQSPFTVVPEEDYLAPLPREDSDSDGGILRTNGLGGLSESSGGSTPLFPDSPQILKGQFI
jgi:hypothetical protein